MASPLDILDAELVKELLDVLAQKLHAAESARDQFQKEVDGILAKIDRLRNFHPDTFALDPPARTEHGRMKKGEALRLITDFLRKRNGTGASPKAIIESTKTSYGTTQRILKSLADAGQVISVGNGVYRWNKELTIDDI